MSRVRVAGLAILAAIPYALGWLAGVVVGGALWIAACVAAGYEAGRGIL